jgi:hypothetical protein
LARLRSLLLATLTIGVLAVGQSTAGSGRLFDSWAFLSDAELASKNGLTADTVARPSGLAAKAGGDAAIDLTWDATTDAYATGYDIFRCSGAACKPAFLVSVGEMNAGCATDTSCTYHDGGLIAMTQYCYSVRTTYLNWVSELSNVACATSSGGVTVPRECPPRAYNVILATRAGVVEGTPGDDLIIAHNGGNTIYGGAGHDCIAGGNAPDILYGGHVFLSSLGGDDVLIGGQGNDELYGGLGDDQLYGGPGDDLLFDILGNNFCDGGQGANDVTCSPFILEVTAVNSY